MLISTKTFNELANHELHLIYRLRAAVFVVEQNCVYQDVDETDLSAHHILFLKQDRLIAYCRIIPPGILDEHVHIGRVAVDKMERKTGKGKQLMKHGLLTCSEMFKHKDVVISAQTYLTKFYKDLGFVAEGEGYDEDGIPHIKMRIKA